MTKKEMVKVIEKSGMVINFSESWYLRQLKEYVEKHYERALKYMEENK